MKIVEKGRSLVKTFECNDCHTAGYLQSKGNVPEDQWLTGESLGWRGPLGTTYGANLRLLIDSLTEAEWVEKSKVLASRPPMPHVILNAMSNEDLQALYQFIRYLGPSGKPAPAYVPSGQEPIRPPAIIPEPPK
ncbi:MAG TPA: cytochrome C [Desulfobacterales bacterium]|nr:cytochrome C [Desulfobacterales bacterium]